MRGVRLTSLAVTAAVMAGVVAASHAPLSPHAPGDALLRLAWSARPERIEHCRAQSDEELARLPPHMRQAVVCEGVTARYRLTARHGGRLVADRVVTAGGLRQDRRLYVLEEIPIAAGEARFEVRFERIDVPSATTGGLSDRRQDAVPPHLTFTEHRRVDPHTVLLVTYDADRQTLVARSPSGSSR
jgi:hypothetical protein